MANESDKYCEPVEAGEGRKESNEVDGSRQKLDESHHIPLIFRWKDTIKMRTVRTNVTLEATLHTICVKTEARETKQVV